MATVDIYLPIRSTTTEWIPALSIPHENIQRLTVRPLKWLRFATFAVCGAKGHLSTTPGGEDVDYQNASFASLADRYYYSPTSDNYHLVDFKVFDDKCTSSAVTPRQSNFFDKICQRDGGCVITGEESEICDAVHVIPKSKGSNLILSLYISFIVRDRSGSYGQLPFSLGEDGEVEADINCIENGILLRKDLHMRFGFAKVVFLKTPNFAMEPADVPQVAERPMPEHRTTLQHLQPPAAGVDTVPQWDVRVDWGDEVAPPPSILLDFMYGAAVVKWWMSSDLHKMLKERFEGDFSQVLAQNPNPKRPLSENDSEVEPDDPNDPNWTPPRGEQKRRKTDAGLLEAMDNMILLSMLLKGKTPQSIAAEQERHHREEEQRSQERSREKVQQWLKSVSAIVKHLFPEWKN